MSEVRIEGIVRRFSPTAAAVDGVSLTIRQGEFVTLLGPSGCGKTTTLRMVAGLERPDSGRITVGDRVVSDDARALFLPPEQRGLGMVFQSYAIWPHMTVAENVAYPLKVRRVNRAEVAERVTRALQLVEMDAYADRPAPALSGGQQQRVAIARALVGEPAVLLLDEPLSNLDARLRTQMGEELRELQRRTNVTTLYVTHDQQEALSLSDRVVVMQRGRILQDASPSDIYRRPGNVEVAAFFGTPNLLTARVTGSPDEGWVELEGRHYRGRCRTAAALPPGTPVTVVVRPEHIRLLPAGTGETPDVTGTVVNALFRGPSSSVVVDDGTTRFHAEISGPLPGIGETVALGFDRDAAWAIADQALTQESAS
ncbi:MAG: ABC transporter ATP-binding protein [Sphingobium sp.]